MSTFQCFSLRRPAPLRSTVQVVQGDDARALSYDGVNWQFQVLTRQPSHGWGSLNAGLSGTAAYVVYAVWSAEEGIAYLPGNPLVDTVAMERATAALRAFVPTVQAPFPAGDPWELWLLDTADEPLALLATARDGADLAREEIPRWRALPDGEPRFGTPGDMHEGLQVERLVRERAGGPRRAQWFRRAEDGSGAPFSGSGPLAGSAPLTAGRFPSLPLREAWEGPEAQALVTAYLAWLAPLLLTLPDLPDAVRGPLEQAARLRALEVEALHRIYPRVVDRDQLNAALVEAALRRRA